MKYKGKLMDGGKVSSLLKHSLAEDFSIQKMYKIVYYLKIRGYLENIKKNIFFVKDPNHIYSREEIMDLFYRTIVKKHCTDFLKGNWYIGGLKALELNLSSFDIPEELSIVNQYKQATEVLMFDKQIVFKTYAKNKTDNLFKFFWKLTKKVTIGKNSFPIAGLELAILESLYNPGMIAQGYINELVKKVIRRYHKTLDVTIWEAILRKNKHNTSINRLYMLTKSIDPDLAEKLKNLIKKYGYFI
ncbi:MAG: hypothetical protein NTY80_00415 [candidate division SR1 bacterium]|nr:hypothetical protein [candidate division SR1 bacterium]